MKLKPYPEYKDSGVECFGNIPNEWELTKLKYLISISSGEYININDIVLNGKYEVFGGNGFLGHSNLYNISDKTIIIGRVGAKCGNVRFTNGKKWVSDNALIVKTDQNYSFISYLLKLMNLNDMANQNAQPLITSTQIKNLDGILPPEKEQRNITSFLDKKISEIDKTIEKDTQLIELLKEKRIALINHIVTKSLDPDAKMKDSGVEWIGEIPEDWEIKKLKRISSKITQGPNPDLSMDIEYSNYKVLKTKDLYDEGIMYESTNYLSEESYLNCVNSRLEDKDILITIVGHGSIGKINIFESQKETFIFTRAIALVRPLLNEINPKFIKYFFESKLGKELLYSLIEGSTGQEVIKTTRLSDLKVVIPSKEQQGKIIKFLDIKTSNIDKTVKKIEKKINLLEEYKKSLIHHVVTGKIDVRGDNSLNQIHQKKDSKQTSLTI